MALPEKRWVQRFDNYEKALAVLGRIFDIKKERKLTEAEQMGLIQSFEFTFELAWKLMKDFLQDKGFTNIIGSKDAFRNSFREGIIKNGEVWFDMLDSRNDSSHAYDEQVAEKVIADVSSAYIDEFKAFLETMKKFKAEELGQE